MLTLTEAAAHLGLDASSLRHQICNGKLRARKVGRDWTVTEREVERYRRENRIDQHVVTIGGVTDKGHYFCTCGRKVHCTRYDRTGQPIWSHTSGTKRIDGR